MNRTARVALAALLLAPLGGVAADVVPAGAGPPNPPTVSATSGGPGTVVEVTIAGCTTDEAAGQFAFVQALLISGTAPDEVLAGAGSSEEGSARIVVPDWLDPADPAVIEATCFSFDEDAEEPTTTVHDPVAFDVLPGVGAPVQTRSFSRTSLLAGQGLDVSGQGCGLPGARYASSEVYPGDDRSGRSYEELTAYGDDELDGQSFDVPVVLESAGGLSLGYSSGSDGVDQLEVEEDAQPVLPGTYTAITYCGDEDGLFLFYEPQAIEVTGSAPVDQVDLTVAPGTDEATLAGTGCTDGAVDATLEAISLGDFDSGFEEELLFDSSARSSSRAVAARPTATSPFAPRRHRRASPADALVDRSAAAGHRSTRALADDGYRDVQVDPDPSGAWAVTDTAGFDQGFVIGYASCGDPFADGFVYDQQAAAIDVGPAPAPPSTVPVTAPTAPPPAAAPAAAAVPGDPTYTG